MPPIGSMQKTLAKLPYVLLALVVAGSMLFYAVSTAATFDSFLNSSRARPPLDYSHSARYLVQPMPESRRAGMHAEDEVLSVNGQPLTGMASLIRQTFRAHPGDIASIVYRNHAGEMHTARVQLMAQQTARPTVSGWVMNILLVALFPLFCLILGYWVVLARPRDRNAWFFLGIMNVVPAFIGRAAYYPGFLTPFTVFWQIFSEQWMFISLILFSVYFPVRSRTDERFPWLKWLVIAPQIPLFLASWSCSTACCITCGTSSPILSAIVPLQTRGKCLCCAFSVCIFIAAMMSASSLPFPLRRRTPAAAWEWWPRVRLLGLGTGTRPAGHDPPSSPKKPVHGKRGSLLGPPHRSGILFTLFPPFARLHRDRAEGPRPAHHPAPGHPLCVRPGHPLGAAGDRGFTFLGFRLYHFAHRLRPSGRILISPSRSSCSLSLFLRLRIARPLSLVD